MKTGNWKIVGGFGAHIKSNRTELIIQHKGMITETQISDITHLLIFGGHNIQTSTITTLINEGVFISFCESDGEPVGYIAPYDYSSFKEIQELQKSVTPYSYAFTCALGSIRTRILTIEQYAETIGPEIIYSGELDLLSGYSKELENMVRIEELRRIEKLVRDMYYEIISRFIDPSLHFKRRTTRPYSDPVNAILSFGYGMLSSACTRALVGGHLNPSVGFLNRGNQALVQDLINCWKCEMIDKGAIEFIKSDGLGLKGYEISQGKCILKDNVIQQLITIFSRSIRQNLIDSQVDNLIHALKGESQFTILR